MRFRAPAREDVAPDLLEHPAFRAFQHRAELLGGLVWPQIDDLNRLLRRRVHRISNAEMKFVAQTPAMLADGRHYESRIFDTGVIATRPENWHDLFNALMWIERFELKCAINAAYVGDRPRFPGTVLPFRIDAGNRGLSPISRTRAQCALTHFDEGGAIVALNDPELLALWDAHDWRGLFFERRARWDHQAEVLLFGHAMLEHRLMPSTLSVAKCLVVAVDPQSPISMQAVAGEIVAGTVLRKNCGLCRWPALQTGIPIIGWNPFIEMLRVLDRYVPGAGIRQQSGIGDRPEWHLLKTVYSVTPCSDTGSSEK